MEENLDKNISYKLILEIDNFSGPLDLLLELIKSQKIDINDIPIVQVTSQFLDFINQFGDQLLDRLSDYLVMATRLTLIKAKMLLPTQKESLTEEVEDPRIDLRDQLLAYDKFIKIADALKMRKIVHKIEYSRPEIFASEWDKPALRLDAVSLDQLVSCMEKIIESEVEREQVFNVVERINISSETVNKRIKQIIKLEGKTTFTKLIQEFSSLDGIIACFVEILSLMRLNVIKVTQKKEFGELFLEQDFEF
ncbi:segregation and condensation protein A [Xylocopilactobacillus apicola]|uniref:Segregation and condensation protein A n=1 Tax=Xylocopilactobacillus apicola TaxID=2932184 RepID=A0AAU9DJK3_9LACO|nr:segregation/condensation protein A [Xylocopilactobacillus apicola]BDR58666.1 segregation and condensation protein A [Xylocopilactobacillus apicola]